MVFTDAYKMSDVIMNGKKFDKIYEDIVENACIAHEILRKCNGFAVETICKERGINLMEVKFHVLMNYVALLKYIILKNSVGKDSADESLVEISTVLGRTRPLIEKMSNEMQKLLESVNSDGTVDCIAGEAEIAAVIEQDEGKNADNCNVLKMQDKYKNDVQLYIFPKLITTHYRKYTIYGKKANCFGKAATYAFILASSYSVKFLRDVELYSIFDNIHFAMSELISEIFTLA
ncbi:Neuroguidin [Trichinella nelsoni]|uniref:Neuroguidin n=1 Tax=Trichinella nelsoni TaxID=6336 RepID=A0A0V0S5Y6_9BILA|nr:Neuroguidin [Trichinella nelsoni]